MLRSKAITIVKRGLGFRQTQDMAIISAMQIAQRTLESGKSLPTFLLVFDAPINITAGDPNFATPDRFLRMHDNYDMYYLNTSGAKVFIPRLNNTEAYQTFVASGNAEAIPATTGNYPNSMVLQTTSGGILVPTPKTSFTAYLTYYRAAELLTAEIENAWLANEPDYLIALAGINVAQDLRDAGALQKFSAMARMAGQGYLGNIVDQELQGRPLIMGRNN